MGTVPSKDSTPIFNQTIRNSSQFQGTPQIQRRQDHVNIYKGTQAPCPICKKINCELN